MDMQLDQVLRQARQRARGAVALHERVQKRRREVVDAFWQKPNKGVRGGGGGGSAASMRMGAAPAGERGRTSVGMLVAEGDSWFDFPFCDVLKMLEDRHGYDIESVARRGESIEYMAYGDGQLADLTRSIGRLVGRGAHPKAILLSGGGNDVAGPEFTMLLDHANSPTAGLNAEVVRGVLEQRVRAAYVRILAETTAVCERMLNAKVPIVLHGYGYPVPDGRGFLGGWGPLPGPWLEPSFRAKGFRDLSKRVEIMRELMDQLNAMVQGLTKLPGFDHVHYLDLRALLSTELSRQAYRNDWSDELHPTRKGFERVAKAFDALLVQFP